jgi:iron(III) transport system substrate-binding protein
MRIKSCIKLPRFALTLGLLLSFCLTAPGGALAAPDAEAILRELESLPQAEREKKLIEGAKKEGSVIWYTTDAPRATQILFKAFTEKYPFVKPQFVRSKSRELLDRITSEVRADRHLFDLAKTSTETFPMYPAEQVFANYNSPAKAELPANMKGDRWASLFTFIRAMGYNTNMVKKEDLPKTWEDLLDPKWEGRILFDQSSLPEVATLYTRWGKGKASAFLDQLGTSGNLQLRKGRSAIAQLLVAGEAPLAVTIYPYKINGLKKKGAPVDWTLLDPTPAIMQPLSIARHAPHPYSAALLYDFLLSQEGQEVYARMGRAPANPNVEASAPQMKAAIRDSRLLLLGVLSESPETAAINPDEIAKALDEKIVKKAFKK